MRRLGLVMVVLLLLTAVQFCSIFLTADDTKVQGWTCGYRGACRKYCYAQEYMVGYHGCPRRLRCCALRF
ncbi:beta-defensin-like 3 [Salmo salar]|uniref:Beta-defensin-like 3 n=1 Tax=Salmo salar TaxID=8030 RepID=A0ABM3DMX6_SALSA|nr:defensin, beta-like 3 [Salmo salar]